jgi:predicted metal-dependent hydrolase
MNTNTYQMTVDEITVNVVRKDIKNLHLGVYPPEGRVRIAVPWTITDDAVRLAVINRLGWIKRQQAKFQAQSRQSPREMVNGESHYFLGHRYRLQVIENKGSNRVEPRNKSYLDLYVKPNTDIEGRQLVLQEWYRKQLRLLIPSLVEKWEPILGVRVAEWRIRKMKTKWGSCNIEAKRIWLNLELAKKPIHCLEYVIVHEMMHLLERYHNERFVSLMDRYLPKWRLYRDELNSTPLPED